MATCIFYVDEGGDALAHHLPLKNGQTPIFCLGAIAFPLNEWRRIDREFLSLKRHYFPDWLQNSTKRDEYYEIKGNDLTAPRNAGSDRRHAYLKAVIDFIRDHSGVCFGVSILKNSTTPTPENSIYAIALQILAERFSQYIIDSQSYNNGIIVCDSRKGMGKNKDDQIAKSYLSYIFGHNSGRSLTNLIEAPFFADSHVSVGLQIVDNFTSILFTTNYAHCLGHLIGGPDYRHMLPYKDKIWELEYKNRQLNMFGYRVLDHRVRR